MGITEAQWEQYDRQGYLHLGRVLTDNALVALQERIDQIMLGKARLDYSRILMQLDSQDGDYAELGAQTRGHKGRTTRYRKIQDLEFDPLFLRYLQRPVFAAACRHVYSPDVPIACFRAMFMNKPARKGTMLPWHQDRWAYLDRDPILTAWTALDRATRDNGCVKVIPGSHKRGLINPEHHSGFLTPAQAQEHCPEDAVVYLELAAGEAVLLHNWLLHSSDVNKTEIPRRAFSVCYMDARTVSKEDSRYSLVFGAGALSPENVAADSGPVRGESASRSP